MAGVNVIELGVLRYRVLVAWGHRWRVLSRVPGLGCAVEAVESAIMRPLCRADLRHGVYCRGVLSCPEFQRIVRGETRI